MKILEVLGLVFLMLVALMLVPIVFGIFTKVIEVVFGLLIAGVVLSTLLGVLLLPLVLLAIFFKWAYKKLTA